MSKSLCILCALLFLTSVMAVAELPMPASQHVVVIMEENHSYSKVIGNPVMPYFNGLADTYGLANNYYANSAGSLKDYLILTGGSRFAAYECGGRGCNFMIKGDNIVPHMLTAGLRWKAYLESIPSPGYLGLQSGNYAKWHNPFAWYSDVALSSSEKLNMVGTDVLLTDLKNNTLPAFSFIVPNSLHGAYVGTLGQADTWLSQMVPKILANPGFQKDGILFILFDEGTPNTDTACSATVLTGCGGHTATLIIGPRVKPGYKSTVDHQHQAVLRSIIQALGMSKYGFLGLTSTTTNMAEFFN